MHLSHRAAFLLILVLVITGLELFSGTKLTRAWAALTGASSDGSSGSAAGTGSTSQNATALAEELGLGGVGGSGTGTSNSFGLSNVTASQLAPRQYFTGPGAPDLGLVSDLVGEWNYLLAPGSQEPIHLPNGGSGWNLIRQGTQTGLGGYEVWHNVTNGATLAFLHLSSLWDQSAGTGGVIGVTGWPTDPAYGNGVAGPTNAHLAVIYNQAGAQYIG